MTNVIELAKQAGAETSDGIHWEFDDFDPIKFAKLVRNQTLEEAAKKCDAEQFKNEENGCWLWEAKNSAIAIRNLKEPT